MGRGAFQQVNDLSEFGHTLCVETKKIGDKSRVNCLCKRFFVKTTSNQAHKAYYFLFIMVYDIKF